MTEAFRTSFSPDAVPERAPAARAQAPAAASEPQVSVIIACYNGADTIERALDSLARQSLAAWEAVVVDDGSSDGSGEVVQRRALSDGRIRLITQPNGGVASARNRGLASARGEWVLFLDCDDWLAPQALAQLTAAAGARPEAGVVAGRAVKVLPDGRQEAYPACDLTNAFELFCCEGRIAINTAIVRRSLIAGAGGFDESLRTSEDWDLWQRLSRSGVQFASLGQVTAFYASRPGSLTRRIGQVARDGLTVMHRGHGPDPRVADPVPGARDGAPPDALPPRERSFLFWCAAREIASGGDGLEIIRLARCGGDVDLEPEPLGDLIANSLGDMLAMAPQELGGRWPEFAPRVRALLEEGLPGEAAAASRALVLATVQARLNAPADPDETIELSDPDPLARHAGKVLAPVLQLRSSGRTLGAVAVPALAPMSRAALARCVAAQTRRMPLKQALLALRPWTSPRFYGALAAGGIRLASDILRNGKGEPRRVLRTHLRATLSDAVAAVVEARLLRGDPAEPASGPLSAPAIGRQVDDRIGKGRGASLELPVLMYHRIAWDGPEGLKRYRTAPEAFEAQLQELARLGFRGVTPAEAAEALRTRRRLPGRPVLLTFDDGYEDFAEHAWPILKRMGFAATLFVVPAKVGGRADWDDAFGTPSPLLDWAALSALAKDGVAIESHSLSHRRMTRLPLGEAYREAAASADEIASRLELQPSAFCYPFGAQDARTARILEETGYALGFTTAPGTAHLASDPMRLPRIEVPGGMSLAAFSARMQAAA